jgi:uncharacterized protein
MNDKIADLAALRAKRRSKRKCPICGKPASEATKPFCSEQCRRVDLDRWRTESYRIPVQDDDEDSDAPPKRGDEEES